MRIPQRGAKNGERAVFAPGPSRARELLARVATGRENLADDVFQNTFAQVFRRSTSTSRGGQRGRALRDRDQPGDRRTGGGASARRPARGDRIGPGRGWPAAALCSSSSRAGDPAGTGGERRGARRVRAAVGRLRTPTAGGALARFQVEVPGRSRGTDIPVGTVKSRLHARS